MVCIAPWWEEDLTTHHQRPTRGGSDHAGALTLGKERYSVRSRRVGPNAWWVGGRGLPRRGGGGDRSAGGERPVELPGEHVEAMKLPIHCHLPAPITDQWVPEGPSEPPAKHLR